ncbi:MAG: IS200/IS605 family transposase [Calditrichaeota bacterium]|nr:IS200/IS605 family transposase [Calditrichota bacterium]
MTNTYTQIFIQIVFSTKHRQKLIDGNWEIKLHKYISGIVEKKGHKMIVINGMSDHIHILIGMKPFSSVSELVREIKKSSMTYINDEKYCQSKFQWQEGFGAFSYSLSDLERVIHYINNQKNHHKQKSFEDEYRLFLEKFKIDFDDRYLFG